MMLFFGAICEFLARTTAFGLDNTNSFLALTPTNKAFVAKKLKVDYLIKMILGANQ